MSEKNTQAEAPCYMCGAARNDHPWEDDPRGGRRRGACPSGSQPTQAEAPSERERFDAYWLKRQRERGFGAKLTDAEMLAHPSDQDDEFHAWCAALATQQPEALAQQERVPLTEEQIHEMALQEQFLLICDDLDAVTEIVRATELAHHIRAARSSEGGQP